MNKFVSFAGFVAVIGLGAAAVPATEAAFASPTPNPFIPAKLEKESMGATLRHPLHKIRTTWDDYFKVWDKPTEGHQCTTLEKIRATPVFFMHRKVEFNIYYNKRGAFFRAILAPFHRDTHVNFSCYAHGADLWDREQRTDVFPFMYIDLKNDKLIRKIDGYPQYTPMRIYGEVTMVSEGFPWITVTGMEPLKEPAHSLASLRDLELAWGQMDKKNWALAEETFKAVLEKDIPIQTRIKVYEALGNTQMHLRKYGSARESLIKGLRLYGTPRVQFVDYLAQKDKTANNSLVMLAKTDLVLGNNIEAEQAAELAIYLESPNPVARAEMGLAIARNGDIKKGLFEIDQAQRLAPGERLPEAFRNRAQVYLMEGKLEDARNELEQAIILKVSDSMYHLELGEVYAALKDTAKAQSSFESAAKLVPDMAEPYYKLAGLAKAAGDAAAAEKKDEDAKKAWELAAKYCEDGEKADDQFVPLYVIHAEVLKALGRPADAVKILHKGLKAGKGNPEMLKAIEEETQKIEGGMAPGSSDAGPAVEGDSVIVDGVKYTLEEAKQKFPNMTFDKKEAAPAPAAEAPKAEEPKKEEAAPPAEEKKQSSADNRPPVIEVNDDNAKVKPDAR
ncbi:MAG: tetratricopeptide repeat protein [Planctomycetota bacterium]|nr:tetratricopeptide repeat protein [Planctomycetota bacterium]